MKTTLRITTLYALTIIASTTMAFAQNTSKSAGNRFVVELNNDSAIQSQAGTGSQLGRAKKSQRFVADAEDRGWLRISFRGSQGWLRGQDTKRISSNAVELTKDSDVRQSAASNSTRLGKARKAQSYARLSAQNGWIRVQFDDRQGWIRDSHLARLNFNNTTTTSSGNQVHSSVPANHLSSGTARANSLLAEREGYGRNAKGGDPKKLYRVTNYGNSGSGSLRAALESNESYWIIFDKNGTINLSNPIKIRSNKTIDGRGRKILIDGGLRIERSRNVIITDVQVRNKKDDAILLTGTGGNSISDFEVRDIWLHHLELFNSHDGLIDIRGATNVTVSWCHFHSHEKSMLIWKDRNNKENIRGMNVTIHHNFFDQTTRRNPSFNYGKLDFYNNYIKRFYEYGLGCFEGSQVLSQNNIYEARPGYISFDKDPNSGARDFFIRKEAVVYDWAGRKPGSLKSTGDQLRNGAKVNPREPNKVFNRPYSANIDPINQQLETQLTNNTGPR